MQRHIDIFLNLKRSYW